MSPVLGVTPLMIASPCSRSYDHVRPPIFSAVASLGEGQVEMIRRDLEAKQAAGMESDSLAVIYALLNQ